MFVATCALKEPTRLCQAQGFLPEVLPGRMTTRGMVREAAEQIEPSGIPTCSSAC
jgi:hypothetical protein